MHSQKLKLLFAGKTDYTYNRDQILITGLKNNGDADVSLFSIKKKDHKTKRILRSMSKEVDFVIVPSFRQKDIAFVKSASDAPVVYDPLISRYMTKVIDYGERWKAPHKYLVDWLSYRNADIILWDTVAHLDYIKSKYNIRKPMFPLYIGVDTKKFYPIAKEKSDIITVGFYGSFNPLQGIDKIIKAAHQLRNNDLIRFEIIGHGSTYSAVRNLASELGINNVNFIDTVPYLQLNEAINRFDICLGVFGTSLKTDVVIPNKIYHYAAAKKPIITKDTPAIRELFDQDKNICLVNNDPKSISEAILTLAHDSSKQMQIARSAYEMITKDYNQDAVAASFINILRTCTS